MKRHLKKYASLCELGRNKPSPLIFDSTPFIFEVFVKITLWQMIIGPLAQHTFAVV